MNALHELPNIGKVLAGNLAAAGIQSAEQLREIGSREAFLRLKGHYPDACINTLFALEGAVRGIRWHSLSAPDKQALRQFFTEAL